MGTVAPIWIERYATFGLIERRGLELRATCLKCGVVLRADLKVLIAFNGLGGSPIDRRPRCKVWNCDGHMIFQGLNGGMWFPLITTP